VFTAANSPARPAGQSKAGQSAGAMSWLAAALKKKNHKNDQQGKTILRHWMTIREMGRKRDVSNIA
jgi:hypothetical protein